MRLDAVVDRFNMGRLLLGLAMIMLALEGVSQTTRKPSKTPTFGVVLSQTLPTAATSRSPIPRSTRAPTASPTKIPTTKTPSEVPTSGAPSTPSPSSESCRHAEEFLPGESVLSNLTFNGERYLYQVTVPASYDRTKPTPLLLYFHGWGDNYEECGSLCTDLAPGRGIIAVSMDGAGPIRSWNGAGTTTYPAGPDGPICSPSTPMTYCNMYSDCNGREDHHNTGECADRCHWTTCIDSVGQAVALLDQLQRDLCVDERRIWASGCSNGGIFLYELARDARSAGRLAGIAPIVGSPHNGFNLGPRKDSRLSFIGMWGLADTTIPPLSNLEDGTKAMDQDGWYYSTAQNVTDLWAKENGCNVSETETATLQTPDGPLMQVRYTGCREGGDVVRYLFEAGHVCNLPTQYTLLLDFVEARSQGSAEETTPSIYALTATPWDMSRSILGVAIILGSVSIVLGIRKLRKRFRPDEFELQQTTQKLPASGAD